MDRRSISQRLAAIRDDATRMYSAPERAAQGAPSTPRLAGSSSIQGDSKTPRKLEMHWGEDEPADDDGDVPVWVRDEWSTTESTVKRAAADAGDESPIVFVFLPEHRAPISIRDGARELRAAAEETLTAARRLRPTRGRRHGRRWRLGAIELKRSVCSPLCRCRLHAHGSSKEAAAEMTAMSSLRAAIETAAGRSLIRLFPKFVPG